MTTDQWAALVGFLLPGVVAVINREPWAPWIKGVIALLSSIAVGTVTALLAGQFTGSNWGQAIMIVFAASQIAYHTWWKGTDIANWIEQHIAGGPKPLAVEAAPAPPPRHLAMDHTGELGGVPGGSGGAISNTD